jgi:hypothetical protein
MKMLYAPALFAVALVAAAPAKAAPVCIDTTQITSSQPQDHGAAILFQMRDGTAWRNTLVGKCSGLDFDGFAWTLTDQRVCENQQSLRVLHSGQVCLLGKFEKVPKASKPG